MQLAEVEARRIGKRMVALAWLAQNASSGLCFGVFGLVLVSIEQTFNVNRSISSLGVPLVLLALGLGAPVIGGAVHRLGVRPLMTAGALLSALGYGCLAMAPNIYWLLAAYAFLVGPGYVLLGAMLPSALVSNWYVTGRGRALGLANMPALMAIVPLIATELLSYGGLSLVFGAAATFMLCLVPLMLLTVGRPADRGLAPIGAVRSIVVSAGVQPVPYGWLARQPSFWALVIMGCILAGNGVVVATHIVALAIGWGMEPWYAATLLTAVGCFGVIGAPLFGWLSDRIGGVTALTLNASLQTVLWLFLISHPSYGVTLAVACGFGIGSGGMTSALYSTLSTRYGNENFGRAYGLFGISNLPFSVGAPAMAGYLYATSGSYITPSLVIVAALLFVIVLGIGTLLADHRRERPSAYPR